MLDVLTQEQRRAARVGGFLYLLTIITANFAEFRARIRLVVSGDALHTTTVVCAARFVANPAGFGGLPCDCRLEPEEIANEKDKSGDS